MPELLKPSSLQQSHAQVLRGQTLRRLSRSPHPYHRQHFELPYGKERFITTSPTSQIPLRSPPYTDDDEPQSSRSFSGSYRESANSDSGTEADDEHFLKGLPAPKLRPHKGLRGADGASSSTPSPLLSPSILGEDLQKSQDYLRQNEIWSNAQNEETMRKGVDKVRAKRRVEVVRRATEAAIIVFVAGILCTDSQVRWLIHMWNRGGFQ